MRSRAYFVGFRSSAVLLFGLALATSLTIQTLLADQPAVTRQQLETDWLRQLSLRWKPGLDAAGTVTVEQDAAGAVDGIKDGKWGFHTQIEDQPWWQVDLQQRVALDRIVMYNRCDGGFAARTDRIQVLLSDDGQQFRPVYQHDGITFFGHTDGPPLQVSLDGATARYVRLQLPGRTYFHLDEVEVYARDCQTNVAFRKPASQSSISPWSSASLVSQTAYRQAVALTVQRGLQLADDLQQRGVRVADQRDRLHQIAHRLNEIPVPADADLLQPEYFGACDAVRILSLRNPLLAFDQILFVKRATTLFPHVSDQYYGWWSRPGGGLYLLEGFRGEDPTIRCLTKDWPDGNFLNPDIDYDGRRILFAWCRHYPELAAVPNKTEKDQLPEDAFYNIFEMDLDDGTVRQLTHGRYDDFDARYLPDGRIVFVSTRKGTALQANQASAQATVMATVPDSFVRCGGGNHRPVAVFTLHRMDADGGNLTAISAFENFEWLPAVANDGRILYARWDYIDRFNGDFFSLWSTNPDGTNGQLVYGNYTVRPQAVFEARPIPESSQLVFTATAHHSITGGSLVLLDRTRGDEFQRPLTRLTPEVCFPETEGWPEHYYAHPWPLSEQYFLTAWSDQRLPPHTLMPPEDPRNPANACGIYLYDAFGNLTLLHRDPRISSVTPVPVAPRVKPPALPDLVQWQGPQQGAFLLQDIYQGLQGVPRGTIGSLRIVGVPPKVQPQMNQPMLGVSAEDPGKFVLGTVPVDADGSAYFEVPAGIPFFFQALNQEGLAVQTMRSLSYVQPGQTLACVGCHDHRDTAPPVGSMPLAAARESSRLTPGPEGSWPLRFDRLIQPILDQRCVECHHPDGEDPDAAALDLTAAKSYTSLLEFGDGDLRRLVFERDRSFVGETPSLQSRLFQRLTDPNGHHGVALSAEELRSFATWVDTYAQIVGSYSEQQEQELIELRSNFAELFDP
jgi:hypothetical protein